MRLAKVKYFAIAILVLSVLLSAAPALADSGRNMYRLYNPNSGEHFYTANRYEAVDVFYAGWKWEGVGWVAPTTGADVYRLYNSFVGDHHYTLSKHERDTLIKLGWTYEGVGWKSGGARSVLRQYNPNAVSGSHNFTTAPSEDEHLASVGWVREGHAWNALSVSSIPIQGFWALSTYTGGLERYWIASDGRLACNRYVNSNEGAGYTAYATSTGAVERMNVFNVDGRWHSADNDGRLSDFGRVDLGVPYLNQYEEEAAMGCEGISLYMALRYKGCLGGWSYHDFQNTVPYSDNPYEGFAGSPWYRTGGIDGMLPPALANWGSSYGPVRDISGCGIGRVLYSLSQDRPVVIWVTSGFKDTWLRGRWYGMAPDSWHVMVLRGFNPQDGHFEVNDPAADDGVYWVDWDTFTRVWEVYRGAVEVG